MIIPAGPLTSCPGPSGPGWLLLQNVWYLLCTKEGEKAVCSLPVPQRALFLLPFGRQLLSQRPTWHAVLDACPQLSPSQTQEWHFKKYIFTYLVVPGLSRGMQDLASWPGIEPGPPVLGHWATRAVPLHLHFFTDKRTWNLKLLIPLFTYSFLVHAIFSKIALLFSVYKSSKLVIFCLI